jgi:hypothetical protein
MIVPSPWPQILDFFGTPLVIEPSPGQLSGDAGLLPVRQFDQRIGLTRAFAEAPDDPRDPGLTEHTFSEMVRSRVYGILAGYADQNDHDALRADPNFRLRAGRLLEEGVRGQRGRSPVPGGRENRALDFKFILTRSSVSSAAPPCSRSTVAPHGTSGQAQKRCQSSLYSRRFWLMRPGVRPN